MFCTMSRVCGSIEIGPRGLSHFMPFIAPMTASASVLPLVALERGVDQMHAVIAADRDEIGAMAGRLFVGRDIVLVELRGMRRGIKPRGDDAKQRVAGGRQIVVIGDVARSDELDAGFFQPALGELLGEGSSLAGRHKDEQRVGLEIVGALQERREVRIGERHFERIEDLAAALGEVTAQRPCRLRRRAPSRTGS